MCYGHLITDHSVSYLQNILQLQYLYKWIHISVFVLLKQLLFKKKNLIL